jgi:hypothetical protein
MQPHEVAFLGIHTAPSRRSEKVEYPLAIGFGYPDLRKTRTFLIRPEKDWDLFAHPEKDDGESVSGFGKKELQTKGLKIKDAATKIRELLAGRSPFSLWPDKDLTSLKMIFGSSIAPLKLLSALGLFNEFVSNEDFIKIEINHKLVAGQYPRNTADVRWMITCFQQCLLASHLR